MSPPVAGDTSLNRHGRHRNPPHIAVIPNETISLLTPYSGLIITVCMVVLCLIRFYLLEKWLFPRYYKRTYLDMDDGLRRGFLNHHIAAAIKVVLLVVGAKPWVHVLFGQASLHTPLGKHRHPTMGDILIVLTQLFVAMYLFELFYRRTMSPIGIAHHVGAVVIAQSAVVLSLDISHQQDATIEYLLCLVWGAFDVLSELWLNVAFIIYRVVPKRHALLTYIFFTTFNVSVYGTLAETIMIFYLFGSSWSRWELSFKVVTPILHVLFTIAQLHTARILLSMWRKEKRKLASEGAEDLETASKSKDGLNGDEVSVVVPATPSDSSDSTNPPPPSIAPGEQESREPSQAGSRQGVGRKIISRIQRFVTGK